MADHLVKLRLVEKETQVSNSTRSIQFYYDAEDGDLKERLQRIARKKYPGLRLSISMIAKALLVEKLIDEEQQRKVVAIPTEKNSSSP